MKKIMLFPLLIVLLVGCTNNKNNAVKNSQSTSDVSQSSSVKKKKVITELNKIGEIKNKDKVAYTLEVTEVIDVTEEAKTKQMNEDTWLNFYSNKQAVQAIRVTIKLDNKTDKELAMPYLDNITIKDSDGITNVGGWKDENGTATQFGSYTVDKNLEQDKKLYSVQPNEKRLATSTVLLATKSNSIDINFKSDKFDDSVIFKLKISE